MSEVQLVRHNAAAAIVHFPGCAPEPEAWTPQTKLSRGVTLQSDHDQGPGGVISVGNTRKLGMISNGISAAKIYVR